MSSPRSAKPPASISQALGLSSSVLPGESQEEYRQGLDATIEELQARTPLQVFIAQKIFDCLWWIRRYEDHKANMLLVRMASRITPHYSGGGLSNEQARIVAALRKGDWSDRTLKSHMRAYNHTPQTLMEAATGSLMSKTVEIEQQIALRTKTLSGLQSAYEALVNRRIHAERLRLQTELLRRDLTAIDVPAIEAGTAGAPDPQSPDAANRLPAKATGQ